MPLEYCLYAGLILLVINGLTFEVYAEDKRRAIDGNWRISEASLLMLALIGGSPAAYAARRIYRHKTRKQPFVSILRMILCLQVLLFACAGFFLAGEYL